MTGSNLPPGCSSPDGGIDHAMESALEQLCDEIDSPETAAVLRSMIAPLENVYRQGFEDGQHEARMDQLPAMYREQCEEIATEAAKRGMCDMDVFLAWRLGLETYIAARSVGARFPSDVPKGS